MSPNVLPLSRIINDYGTPAQKLGVPQQNTLAKLLDVSHLSGGFSYTALDVIMKSPESVFSDRTRCALEEDKNLEDFVYSSPCSPTYEKSVPFVEAVGPKSHALGHCKVIDQQPELSQYPFPPPPGLALFDAMAKDQDVFLNHAIGECHPCVYFRFKADGCRKGGSCEFCHICSKGEARVHRRELGRKFKSAARKVEPPASDVFEL